MRLAETLVRGRGTGFALSLGRCLGRLIWMLLPGRRALSLANAEVALPDLPPEERRRAVREAVLNSSAFYPELLSYCYLGPEEVLGNVEVRGIENLEAALARGKGVVAPSIHLGNFPLILVWLGQRGYKTWVLTRYPHDERVTRRFRAGRRTLGIKGIRDTPRQVSIKSSMRVLRERNGILFIQLDQRAASGGVSVKFFGRPFSAFMGPVWFALRAGAAVVPMYILRTRGIKHRIVIEPEFELARTGDRKRDVRVNLQALMRRFEGWIRAHPDQWWWFSRRW